ncbi:MAG: hypothetical protein RL033_808 [Pseudomonadota bacterium]
MPLPHRYLRALAQHGPCCSLTAMCLLALSCRKPEVPPQAPGAPSVRLYLVSNLAGALEPCGCRKDMLGGIDHAGALLAASRQEAPQNLLLGAGPLLFQEPQLDPARGDQDVWKAGALADSLAELKLGAWAPGLNDFAAGNERTAELTRRTGAKLLAANVRSPQVASTATFDVGGYRVGVAGIGVGASADENAADAGTELANAARALETAGAQIRVALVAADRGAGLRLAEKVPGFSLILLGRTQESGDANDAPSPPTLVGDTLVVQTSNHLQSLAYVDFFVKGDDFSFQDGMGLAREERKQGLEQRIAELERRVVRWRSESPASPERVAGGEKDLQRLQAELAALRAPAADGSVSGSVFRYRLLEVRENAGAEPNVARRMSEYYQQVNTRNREAFKDRLPTPAAPGTAYYLGSTTCANCHEDADTFWRTTQHSRAYRTLETQFKEFNLDCVSCHVTGYDRPGGSTVTHAAKLQNVQCESCHGPGSLHVENPGANGLIRRVPEPSTCRGCHHAPHVADDWSHEQAWSHIVGSGHGAGATPPPTR